MTARPQNQPSPPLKGLLALSLEQAVAAPMCTLRLADAGARVIKVERAEGDTARGYDSLVHGTSAYFAWLNRGKESIALDLKSPSGRTLIERILERADIFVQNLLPGATTRLGLGAADLRKRHPRLIIVDIVGYGQDTPLRAQRAYDMLVQAESGICAVTGTEDTPSKVGVSVADIATGMNAYSAILEALVHRNQTGEGAAIEIAMFDTMAEWMSVPLLQYQHGREEPPRVGLAHAQIYPYGRFACADGSLVIAVQSAAEWARFCVGVLRRPNLVEDRRFADNPSRLRHRKALDVEINAAFSVLPLAELLERLDDHRIAWGRYSSVSDLARHPALRTSPVRVPQGQYDAVASPLRRDLGDKSVPALNQHGAAIETEFMSATGTGRQQGRAPMKATGLNHLSVSAKNLDESLAFYEKLFLMERIPTYNFGFRTQYLRCGDQQLHVFELQETIPRYQHFALDVDDFQGLYERAKSMGVLDSGTFGNPINELPDGSVQMYVRDPAGNLVEIDWPDVTTLDVSRIPELKKLSDRHPQTGENLEATLYLGGRNPARRAG